jgi:prepilin-type processing-associated H-X9-DG protein
MTLKGTAALIVTNANERIIPQSMTYKTGPMTYTFPARPMTEVVLAADATLSQTAQHDPTMRYTGNYEYTTITGGSYPKPHITAHLNGKVPAGGNIVMLDGHAEWRKFDAMTVRGYGGVNASDPNPSSPTFWW